MAQSCQSPEHRAEPIAGADGATAPASRGDVQRTAHQALRRDAALVAEEAVDASEADAAGHVLHLARQLQLLLCEAQQLLL